MQFDKLDAAMVLYTMKESKVLDVTLAQYLKLQYQTFGFDACEEPEMIAELES